MTDQANNTEQAQARPPNGENHATARPAASRTILTSRHYRAVVDLQIDVTTITHMLAGKNHLIDRTAAYKQRT